MPKNFPPYLSGRTAVEYMEAYAKKFSLREQSRLETEVVSVEKANDWDETGCWMVTVRDRDGEEETHRFGSVPV